MGTYSRIRTANDNAPVRLAKRQQGDNSIDYLVDTPLAERPSPRPLGRIPDMLAIKRSFSKPDTTVSLKLTIGCWLAALVIMLSTFLIGGGTGPKALSSLFLFWTGLWSSYVAADHGHWRLSEISVVTALGGLMGAIITAANYFGLGFTLADGLLLLSVLPLFIGYMLKSRISVLASICASLIWTALSFMGLVEASYFTALFPIILSAQIFIATKIRSGLAITLAVLAGYYWLSSFILTAWTADNLPLTFAAASLFILGTAHHRSGKAAEDKELTGSAIHIYAGWMVAMVGAIGFQHFWLTPEAIQGSSATLSASGLGLWKGIILAALVTIFCSAIIRYKHSQISLAGIFVLTAASAIIPMMLWFPGWPQKITSTIPGLNIMPAIGIFMGAAITATAIGMMLNGIRRHSPAMIGLGITALFAEAYLLIKPDFMTVDNIIIFATGLFSALAIGATIAGTSLAHQAPAPRLKYS